MGFSREVETQPISIFPDFDFGTQGSCNTSPPPVLGGGFLALIGELSGSLLVLAFGFLTVLHLWLSLDVAPVSPRRKRAAPEFDNVFRCL